MGKNVASGGYTPFQIGEVHGKGDGQAEQAKTPPSEVRGENIRTGNATVGAQHDTITGDLVFRFDR